MGAKTKKVAPQVRELVEKCVKLNHRALFFIIGDKGRLQVSNFHYLLSKLTNTKPNVLWCYKKKLQVSSNRAKRLKIAKKLAKRLSYDAEIEDPFELFLSTTDIRYCFYKDTHQILGQTFNILVLQDFEALTPNIMCRTIETVKGGGIIIFMLDTISSLESIYTITMDSHKKYTTARFTSCQSRFIKRMILSLSINPNALFVDDELNLLPIIKPSHERPQEDTTAGDPEPPPDDLEFLSNADKYSGIQRLYSLTRTADQGKTFYKLLKTLVNNRNSEYYVALTASRGRGKSALLGLVIAAALSMGYTNIIVTAPVPENVATLFEFVITGLEKLSYKSHTDFTIYSLNKEEVIPIETTNLTKLFTGSRAKTTRVTTQIAFKGDSKQTVTYLYPEDLADWNSKLISVDLLVIDEAAALPIHLLRKCKGPFITLLSSTINGYEGTGRALSLKLFNEIESRFGLEKLEMSEPIRYAPNDATESWLNQLLCLNATTPPDFTTEILAPQKCELFQVDRDALMSFHPSAEEFLFNLKSTFISSHYKNSPDDFMLMSDSPSHAIFVLLSPSDRMASKIPNVICAIQVSLEGRLTRDEVLESINGPKLPSGDLIPWTITQHYIDEDFGALSGVRIVRIAVHPHLHRMGYGKQAVKLLIDFISNTKGEEDKLYKTFKTQDDSGTYPLLVPCEESFFGVKVDYIGASFGLTHGLIKFWTSQSFYPVYLRQTPSEAIGEHSCIVLRQISGKNDEGPESRDWVSGFNADFTKRLLFLLGGPFRHLSLHILDQLFKKAGYNHEETPKKVVDPDGVLSIGYNDLNRLDRYAKQFSELRSVLDLLPLLTILVFTGRVKVELSTLERAILLGIASQMKKAVDISAELDLPANQILSILHKGVFKINAVLREEIVRNVEKEEECAIATTQAKIE